MRKNGFTLIELLAVIVILAIIALIATPIILGIINDAREESNERSVELYASAVRNGIAAYQLREGKEVLPGTYNESNPLPFKPEYEGKVDCENVIIGEDGKVSLEGCTVNGGEKQYSYGIEQETPSLAGTIGICNPLSVATEGTYTAGDKYECDVDPNKEGYDQIFYVLTNATSGSVNLIMDSNITRTGDAIKDANPTDKGLVAWITQTDYEREDVGGKAWDDFTDNNTFGPISAIEYLQDATKGWTNVNPQTISTFTDNAGEPHNMAITYTTNARLPYYSEISDVSSSKLYLIDYLYGGEDADIPLTGRNGVEGVYGYWTLSSIASSPYSAWYVYCDAGAGSTGVGNVGAFGVRPVITLSI